MMEQNKAYKALSMQIRKSDDTAGAGKREVHTGSGSRWCLVERAGQRKKEAELMVAVFQYYDTASALYLFC